MGRSTGTVYLSPKWSRAIGIGYKSIQSDLVEVASLDESHIPRIVELIQKYADLPMDLADASLVIVAEQLGHGRILSTDQRDFQSYRWKQHKPFDNLLLKTY